MGSPISMRPVGHLLRNFSAWNNSHNRSPLRCERKHLPPRHATAGGSRPVLMFCRDAKVQSFSARHSGMLIVGSWSLACDEDSQRRRSLTPCQGIQSFSPPSLGMWSPTVLGFETLPAFRLQL